MPKLTTCERCGQLRIPITEWGAPEICDECEAEADISDPKEED